jgi:hypothetical protein
MTAAAPAHTDTAPTGADDGFPPVTQLLVGSLALVVIGGIIMAAYAPRRPPLGAPIALFVASVVLYAIGFVLMTRIPDFAWATFRKVAGWALLAYVISAGMIEYAFVHNKITGAPLTVVTLLLVVFAVEPPTLMAYTTARYHR